MRRIIYKIAKFLLFWALSELKKVADKNKDGKISVEEVHEIVADARDYLRQIKSKAK